MATIAGRISPHHNSGSSPYRFVCDIPDGADPVVHALLLVINDEYGIDADQDAGAVIAALDEARTTGKPVSFEVRDFGLDGEDEGESNQYTLWVLPPEKGETKPNIGIGPGEGKDRNENRWVEVGPYEPDPAMRERLEKLDKDKLLEILLRTHAATYLSLPA